MKKTIQIIILLITIGFSSFAQTVDLQKGLVAYYPFNGNANDESGNGNNATVYGARLTTDRNGKSNSAYNFDGINDYIDENSVNFNNNRVYSVSFWVEFNTVSKIQYLIDFRYKSQGNKAATIIANKNYGNYTVFGDGQWKSGYIQLKTRQWYHFVTIHNSNNNKITTYINGSKDINTSINTDFNVSSSPIRIGARGETKSNPFNGKIDEIRIYNRALNEAEIKALHNDQEKIVDAPLITFKSPNTNYITTNQSSYKIKACIQSSEPLKNYTVYVNGYSNRGFNVVSSSECDFKLEKTINLNEGNNKIKIVAENSGGSTTSSIYTINYEKIVTDNIPPEITITYPNVSRGFKPVEQNKQITIQGNAKDASGIFEILVNGQEAYIDAQGNFTKNVLLAVGDNSFTVAATDLKQNTSTKTFTIERKTQQQETVIVNETTNNTNVLQTGKYYALIIGNNSYNDNAISSLDEPINDATKLYNVLTTQYTFEPQNVTLLKNATYVQMIEAFDNLSNTLTENDNLLVFYAGHGWWDEDKNLGYWLPTDAKKNSTAFWIGNSRISDYMSSIKSKHTLLIADACFSGSIFKTRSAFSDAQPAINKLYELPSKTAMTSGNLKEVPDKSVFLQYLVKRLNDNTEKYISADQLFASFRIAVMNNSTTEPQFGTIQNAGDEGGEFIFIRK